MASTYSPDSADLFNVAHYFKAKAKTTRILVRELLFECASNP